MFRASTFFNKTCLKKGKSKFY